MSHPTCVGTIGPMSGLSYLPVQFQRAYQDLLFYTKAKLCTEGQVLAECPEPHSFPNTSRDHMCRYADGDWLVMLDCDMVHKRDTVEVLVNEQKRIERETGEECGVLTGVYTKRDVPPSEVLVHDFNPEHMLWESWGPERFPGIAEGDFSQYGKCDAAGAGALLIMRPVIERIVTEMHVGPFSVWGPLKRDSIREPLGAGTDDLAFFRRLQVLDPPVQAWYTPRVTPQHLSTVGFTMHDWLRTKQRQVRVSMQGEDGATSVQ